MLENLSIQTSKRIQLINITQKIQAIISKQKINEGFCIVFVQHTTAAITIQENADESVPEDLLEFLNKLVPQAGNYKHADGNADAHIKSALIGNSVTIPIKNSELLLGTWQAVFFCEFDGPRKRKVTVQIVKI